MTGFVSLRFGLSVLMLIIGLTVYGSTVRGQSSCIDDCLEAYDECLEGGGIYGPQALFSGSTCQDEYLRCVDRCMQ